jgi:hypothetical protein
VQAIHIKDKFVLIDDEGADADDESDDSGDNHVTPKRRKAVRPIPANKTHGDWVTPPTKRRLPNTATSGRQCTLPADIAIKPELLPSDRDVLPIDTFNVVFPPHIITYMCEQFNDYYDFETSAGRKKPCVGSHSRPDGGWTTDHIRGYLRIRYRMGLYKKRSLRDYWSKKPGCGDSVIAATMPRAAYELLHRFAHYSDKRNKKARGQPGYDVLYNWRPMQRLFNKAWGSAVPVTCDLTLDEMMAKLASHHLLKRRQPNKPIRDGFMIWGVCHNKGKWCFKACVEWGKAK